MAVIFFDGFSANRPRNDRFWGFGVNAGESETGGRVFGSTETHRNGTSPNSGALKFKAFGEAAKQQAQTCFFTAQSDKKLFFGFAVSGLQLYPTGTNAAGVAFSPPTKRKLKLFELQDDTSPTATTVLTVYAAADLSPTKLLLCVDSLTTEYEIPLDAITDFEEESATFNTHTQSAFVVRQPGTEDADFIYLEFAIDMTDETETVLSCRFNDIPLFLTNSPSFTEDLILPAPLTNVAAIKLYGGIARDMYIDDFYVSDNTGTVNTTFLGRETRILSPNLAASEKTDWTVVSNQTPANPTLNTVDVENYITSATANQISTFAPTANMSAVLVAAVSMTSYARKTALNARYEHVYQRLGTTTSVAGFTVSVADNLAASGSYCLDGTHNSRPKYKKAANNWYIYYDSSSTQWVIASSITINSWEWAYSSYGDVNNVPTSGWNSGMGGYGMTPVVTAESCAIEGADGSIFSIGGPKIVTNLSYTCPANSFCNIPHTTVVEQNPETSARWTIAEINSGTFGVRSLTPPL